MGSEISYCKGAAFGLPDFFSEVKGFKVNGKREILSTMLELEDQTIMLIRMRF